uniref:Prominin-1 n=1 Tax=Heterorhabditis bacteriophora TaxID=37862 RepID=A0A1I7XQ55_HETBA
MTDLELISIDQMNETSHRPRFGSHGNVAGSFSQECFLYSVLFSPFFTSYTGAKDVQSTVHEAQRQIKVLNENGNRFEIEFARLRKTATEELLQCVANEIDPLKAMCHKAEKLLESMQGTQMRFIVSELLSPSIDEALQQIISTNISELLSASNSHFIITENALQTEIDKKVYCEYFSSSIIVPRLFFIYFGFLAAKNMLKQIGDDLFVVAETISTQIRQINFDELYNKISKVSDTKQSPVMKYVHYSWYASLALTSVFVLIAFCFLIGLFYGVCGRRPTFYNDDCCVRSTGGRFYSCGIWLTVLMFTVLAIITAVLLFVFGNSSNLICQPLRDPLSRPDLMSSANGFNVCMKTFIRFLKLLERYMEMWRGNERKLNDLNVLFDQRTPADVIRACQRNETFYEIFELDKKYHLNQLKEFEKESYIQLEKFLRHTLDDLPTINPVNAIISKQDLDRLESLGSINISQLSQEGIDRVKSTITELDLLYKSKLFENNSDNSSGRPKAVTSVDMISYRLKDMQIPVSSLLGKLQHAQALLSDDIKQHFKHASKDELDSIADSVNQYIYHVKFQMQHEVSSCTPIAELSTSFTSALCSHTIDPLNGAWMSMLVCLLCLVPIVIFSTTLVNLYENMHSFPKYIVEPPQEHHQMSSFITDTYDTRQKP